MVTARLEEQLAFRPRPGANTRSSLQQNERKPRAGSERRIEVRGYARRILPLRCLLCESRADLVTAAVESYDEAWRDAGLARVSCPALRLHWYQQETVSRMRLFVK